MPIVAGIVLCGGASRRMGRPKASLPFGPETLLERVVRQLSEAVDVVVVAASPNQPVPSFDPGRVRVVRDRSPQPGPIHALAAALAELPDQVEFAYLAAVDVPRFAPDWPGLLLERIGRHEAAAAIIEGRIQPFAALYRVDAARGAAARLAADGVARLTTLLERLDTCWILDDEVDGVDPLSRLFQDLDHPEDYRRALAEREENPRPPTRSGTAFEARKSPLEGP